MNFAILFAFCVLVFAEDYLVRSQTFRPDYGTFDQPTSFGALIASTTDKTAHFGANFVTLTGAAGEPAVVFGLARNLNEDETITNGAARDLSAAVPEWATKNCQVVDLEYALVDYVVVACDGANLVAVTLNDFSIVDLTITSTSDLLQPIQGSLLQVDGATIHVYSTVPATKTTPTPAPFTVTLPETPIRLLGPALTSPILLEDGKVAHITNVAANTVVSGEVVIDDTMTPGDSTALRQAVLGSNDRVSGFDLDSYTMMDNTADKTTVALGAVVRGANDVLTAHLITPTASTPYSSKIVIRRDASGAEPSYVTATLPRIPALAAACNHSAGGYPLISAPVPDSVHTLVASDGATIVSVAARVHCRHFSQTPTRATEGSPVANLDVLVGTVVFGVPSEEALYSESITVGAVEYVPYLPDERIELNLTASQLSADEFRVLATGAVKLSVFSAHTERPARDNAIVISCVVIVCLITLYILLIVLGTAIDFFRKIPGVGCWFKCAEKMEERKERKKQEAALAVAPVSEPSFPAPAAAPAPAPIIEQAAPAPTPAPAPALISERQLETSSPDGSFV